MLHIFDSTRRFLPPAAVTACLVAQRCSDYLWERRPEHLRACPIQTLMGQLAVWSAPRTRSTRIGKLLSNHPCQPLGNMTNHLAVEHATVKVFDKNERTNRLRQLHRDIPCCPGEPYCCRNSSRPDLATTVGQMELSPRNSAVSAPHDQRSISCSSCVICKNSNDSVFHRCTCSPLLC